MEYSLPLNWKEAFQDSKLTEFPKHLSWWIDVTVIYGPKANVLHVPVQHGAPGIDLFCRQGHHNPTGSPWSAHPRSETATPPDLGRSEIRASGGSHVSAALGNVEGDEEPAVQDASGKSYGPSKPTSRGTDLVVACTKDQFVRSPSELHLADGVQCCCDMYRLRETMIDISN